MVSEAHGDISSTATPCRAMFRVAATSHRQDQVTLRIHRLHAMQPSVMAMRVATDIAFASDGGADRAGAPLTAGVRRVVGSVGTVSWAGGRQAGHGWRYPREPRSPAMTPCNARLPG